MAVSLTNLTSPASLLNAQRRLTATANVTQYLSSSVLDFSPASTSQALGVAIYGKNTYTGVGGFSGTGHTIAGLFDKQVNAPSQTVSLAISCEGVFSLLDGTVTKATGLLSSLNTIASGKTIVRWNGVTSHGNSGTLGTVTDLDAYTVDYSAFAGTITNNFINYRATNPAGTVSGLVYGFYAEDLTAGAGAAAFSHAINSGSLRYGLFFTGTAQNALMGATYIGATTSAGNGSALEVTGVIEALTDRGIRLSNQTSAAAANTGTLTNAPTSGNPGHWLKIKIGATNYAIPCWAG